MPHTPHQPDASRLQRVARTLYIDSGLPAPIRNAKLGYVVTLTVAVIALLAIFALAWLGVGPAPGNAPMYAYFILIVLTAIFCHYLSKRALRHAAAADHLLCPECTYDLRALGEKGTCPECGRAYEHDAVRAQWLDAERRLKGD